MSVKHNLVSPLGPMCSLTQTPSVTSATLKLIACVGSVLRLGRHPLSSKICDFGPICHSVETCSRTSHSVAHAVAHPWALPYCSARESMVNVIFSSLMSCTAFMSSVSWMVPFVVLFLRLLHSTSLRPSFESSSSVTAANMYSSSIMSKVSSS